MTGVWIVLLIAIIAAKSAAKSKVRKIPKTMAIQLVLER